MAFSIKDEPPSPKTPKSPKSPRSPRSPKSPKNKLNKIIEDRKRSTMQQKVVTEKIYMAPVIKQRYRRYVSHFHKTKFSTIADNKMVFKEPRLNPGVSI